MRFLKSSIGRFALAALIPLSLAAVSSNAEAQYGRRQQNDSRTNILEWQGQVDREIRIQVDNRQASVIEVGSNERSRRRVNMMGSIPNRPGTLYVQVLQGRGEQRHHRAAHAERKERLHCRDSLARSGRWCFEIPHRSILGRRSAE